MQTQICLNCQNLGEFKMLVFLRYFYPFVRVPLVSETGLMKLYNIRVLLNRENRWNFQSDKEKSRHVGWYWKS